MTVAEIFILVWVAPMLTAILILTILTARDNKPRVSSKQVKEFINRIPDRSLRPVIIEMQMELIKKYQEREDYDAICVAVKDFNKMVQRWDAQDELIDRLDDDMLDMAAGLKE